jgi:hypothetical protein
MSKGKVTIPAEQLEAYNQLIALNLDIERKGKTTPYTSMNGHMFSFLSKEGTMGLRLSEEDRNNFIEKFESQLMEQHGRIMKEYVTIPNELLLNTDGLSEYLRQSLTYVKSLKPKKK